MINVEVVITCDCCGAKEIDHARARVRAWNRCVNLGWRKIGLEHCCKACVPKALATPQAKFQYGRPSLAVQGVAKDD